MEFDPDIVKIFVPMMRALEGRMSISHLEAGSGTGEAGAGAPPVAAPSQNPLPFPPQGSVTAEKKG